MGDGFTCFSFLRTVSDYYYGLKPRINPVFHRLKHPEPGYLSVKELEKQLEEHFPLGLTRADPVDNLKGSIAQLQTHSLLQLAFTSDDIGTLMSSTGDDDFGKQQVSHQDIVAAYMFKLYDRIVGAKIETIRLFTGVSRYSSLLWRNTALTDNFI